MRSWFRLATQTAGPDAAAIAGVFVDSPAAAAVSRPDELGESDGSASPARMPWARYWSARGVSSAVRRNSGRVRMAMTVPSWGSVLVVTSSMAELIMMWP